MTRRSRRAALEIQILLEEYSAQELQEALALLGEAKSADLLTFLRASAVVPSGRGRHPPGGVRSPASRDAESRIISQLRATDPEKYRLLSDFERQVREGALLPTLEDFRDFGLHLGKGFEVAKSRKQALPALMGALAHLTVEAIEDLLPRAAAAGSGGEDGFGRLADHIIMGAGTPKRQG